VHLAAGFLFIARGPNRSQPLSMQLIVLLDLINAHELHVVLHLILVILIKHRVTSCSKGSGNKEKGGIRCA
jgi:hypothetical protein